MRTKHKKRKRKSILLPFEERNALSARAKRETISCPECGEKAERSLSNGKWRCFAAEDVPSHVDQQGKVHTISILTCCARGATLPNGDLVTTEALLRR